MKKHSFDLKVSMETIARQSGKFHEELTKCIRYLREDGTYQTIAIRNSRINDVIKLYTGIRVNVNLRQGTGVYTYFPMLAGTHVLSYNYGNDVVGRMVAGINELGNLKGSIDPAKGLVTGDFSKLNCVIGVGTGYLSDKRYSDEELAAIVIHEVGHLFTYFQYITTVVVGPAILAMTANALLAENDRSKRTVILKTAEETLGIEKSLFKEDYVSNPKPGLDVMMLNDFMTNLPIGTMDMFYNVRLAEQMADTFTVKHCGAKYLASALNKSRKNEGWQKDTFFSHLLAETSTLFKLLKIHKTSLIGILFNRFIPEKYDRPKDRFEYMKLMLIDELKTLPTTDKELRDTILLEIKAIDDINNDLVYRRDVITFFWDTVGKGRGVKKDTEQQKALERMVYNDLFYKATQLRQLADK